MIDILWMPILSLILGGSLVVWVGIVSRWRRGLPALPFRERNAVHLSAFLPPAAVAGWFLSRGLVAELLPITPEPSLANVQAASVANVLVILIAAGLLVRPRRYRLSDLGIRFRESAEEATIGAQGFLASVLPVVCVLIASYPLRNATNQHKFLQLLRTDASAEMIFWIGIAVNLLAPLSEELLFRVIVQGTLQTRYRPGWAIGLTAAAFAAVHGWPDVLPLYPLAIVLGYVYYRRNSFAAVVILHSLFNAANLLLSLLAPS